MRWKSFIKIGVSVVMIAHVLSTVDFSKLLGTITRVSWGWAIVVLLGYTVGQFISIYKWWLLARSGGIKVPYSSALKSYFIGMYINCFGLGLVGGDLARGILIADGKPQKSAGLASVIADRLHGLTVLALIGSISTLCFGRLVKDPALALFLDSLGFVLLAGWFLGPRILLAIVGPQNKYRQKAEEVTGVFPQNPARLVYISLVSVAFHFWQIVLHFLIGQALGVTIPLAILFVTIPFVNMMASLPISWNGLGVREKAYVFFMHPAILSSEQAVAMGALWLVGVTISSMIGGVVAFITKDFEVIEKASKEAAEEAPAVSG